MIRASVWIWGAGMLTGCQTQGFGADASSGSSELISYANELRRLDSDALELEFRNRVVQYDTAPSEDAAIRLSLLLSDPSAPFHDVDRAIRLLSEPGPGIDWNEPSDFELKRFIRNLLSERSCVAADQSVLAELLVEERSRNERLLEQLADAEAALAAERQYRETLQTQLDALRAIEQQITEEDLGSTD